jgi:hypothetical protein
MSTMSIVTSPACGIPAAPIDANVAVKLHLISHLQHTAPDNTYFAHVAGHFRFSQLRNV